MDCLSVAASILISTDGLSVSLVSKSQIRHPHIHPTSNLHHRASCSSRYFYQHHGFRCCTMAPTFYYRAILLICMIISIAVSGNIRVLSHRLVPRVSFIPSSHKLQQPSTSSVLFVSSTNSFVHRPARVMSPPHGSCSMSSASTASADDIYPSTDIITNNNKSEAMIAKRVSATRTSINECGERLRSGKLVSFPTETVYGLGCNALDPVAVQRVFDAKERPLSDPLIVHVTRSEDAFFVDIG